MRKPLAEVNLTKILYFLCIVWTVHFRVYSMTCSFRNGLSLSVNRQLKGKCSNIISYVERQDSSYLHVRRWDPSWPLGTVGWWEAACSGCSGCCGTWPCSWTGRRHPAGPRTAFRTCWAVSPRSSAGEPRVPSSGRYGTEKRGARRQR